jgi:hypothetical protein
MAFAWGDDGPAPLASAPARQPETGQHQAEQPPSRQVPAGSLPDPASRNRPGGSSTLAACRFSTAQIVDDLMLERDPDPSRDLDLLGMVGGYLIDTNVISELRWRNPSVASPHQAWRL